MVKLCLVCSAEQSVLHPNRSFHKIPKDVCKREKWLRSIGRKSSYNGAVVCSDHFSPDDFFPREGYTVLPRLRSSAVPKLNKRDNRTPNKEDECESIEANDKEFLVQNKAQTYNTVDNDQEISVTENQSNRCNVPHKDNPTNIVDEKIIPVELNLIENEPRSQIKSACLDRVSHQDIPINIVEERIILPELDHREIKPRKRKKELLEMFLSECPNLKIRQIHMHRYATIKEKGLGIEEKVYTIL